jgi:hypothetical protein
MRRLVLALLTPAALATGILCALALRRRRAARHAPAEAAASAAVGPGIAAVDPEPMTQIAGEGIDLEADAAAHRDTADLRARLPVRGVNVP